MRTRVAILISGRGTNMAALIAAAADPAYPADIALVLADTPGAPGLARAEAACVPTLVLDHRAHSTRQAHEAAINAALLQHGIALVALAGYMRLLTPVLIDAWAGRMLNIHPSLLPSFPGLHTHARALAAGVQLHGCTVHRVVQAVDAGPILAQAAVPVLPDDDEPRLAARVLAQEIRLYPRALRAALGGPIDTAAPDAALAQVAAPA